MPAIAHIDHRRESVASRIPAEKKSELGQFMTPSAIASFMAAMFADVGGRELRLLDAGAGIGSLAAAFAQRAAKTPPRSLRCVAWELDPSLREHLAQTLKACSATFAETTTEYFAEIREDDFILAAAAGIRYGTTPRFSHAILNPPYRKLAAASAHRRALRQAGIETSNLYGAFVALAVLMLEDGGELVAITPRSFCNGTYFKAFRKVLLDLSAIRQVHVFGARNRAFADDDVLQENIVFRVVKGARQGDVILSSSSDATFADLEQKRVPFGEMVLAGDAERIIHLPTDAGTPELALLMGRYRHTLEELGIGVSTGPVADFRLKSHLREDVDAASVPLIYCLHFADGHVAHPKPGRKPNAIVANAATTKWLMPSGHYVCVRRLSSKEEKRRIVPALFDPARIECAQVGFDNHMNVFHQAKRGLPPLLARGLAVYLGSTLADRWFRRFSGHTQVNAGDLRALRYPDRMTLESWGARVGDMFPVQAEIDLLVDGSP